MTIFIDADGCPVVNLTIQIAKTFSIPVCIICDTSHEIERSGAQTITVSKGADSADFALVNRVEPNDIVITQDYGLAAMCLARSAIPINQDGMIYTQDNMDALLLARHTARKIRNAGGRLKGNAKRDRKTQDKSFETTLTKLLSNN